MTSSARASRANGSRMRTVALAWIIVSLSGCGRKTVTTPMVEQPMPPQVAEVFPPSRAVRVPYTTDIWVTFREPLDSATVTPKTVFLKVDTRRTPVSVSLDDSARRIVVRPLHDLGVRQIYTVEISPAVHTARGTHFDRTYFWQFITISVRKVDHPEPGDGSNFESPVAPLYWHETEPDAGQVEYTGFVGDDSAQVAGATTASFTTTSAFRLAPTRWAEGSRVFWKVRVRNLDTGDEDTGPVWRFDVAPPNAPQDTLIVPVLDYGTWDVRNSVWNCSQLLTSGLLVGFMRFDFSAVDSQLVVADAIMAIRSSESPTSRNPLLHQATQEWIPCATAFRGPPPYATFLAPCIGRPDNRIWFVSDPLSSQVQARVRRHHQIFDYELTSSGSMFYFAYEPTSGIEIHYYRRPGSAHFHR